MVGKPQASPRPAAAPGGMEARILLIEAPYYMEVARELLAGAVAELEAAGATFERVSVAGALEIPQALAQAIKAGLIGSEEVESEFDGCVALGCVIRGETSHYEMVCTNANHWLMELAIRHAIPVGNAILTVENEAQALARARGERRGKGAEAVRACLSLITIGRAFEGLAQ